MSINTKSTKAELIARINELEAEAGDYAAQLGIARVAKIKQARTHMYVTNLIKHNADAVVTHTPGAVDIIRKYYWKNHETMSRADMISALTSRGLAKGTVTTRISWLIAGRDESCYSEAIRERLGLNVDENEEA